MKAKTLSNLKFDAVQVAVALRSCFPQYRATGRKKASTVLQAEVDDDDRHDAQFDDVEALADHDASFQDDSRDGEGQSLGRNAVER